MYGLGIRIGFYLQWYSSVIASLPVRSPYSTSATLEIAPGESRTLTFSILLFTAATSLALGVQAGRLALAEIYIVLLLVFWYHYHFILHCITQAAACYFARRDKKNRRRQQQHGPVFVFLASLLMASISCFELYFWCRRVPSERSRKDRCGSFGFGFTKVDLTNMGFMGFNILYSLFRLFWSLLGFWAAFCQRSSSSPQAGKKLLHSKQRYDKAKN